MRSILQSAKQSPVLFAFVMNKPRPTLRRDVRKMMKLCLKQVRDNFSTLTCTAKQDKIFDIHVAKLQDLVN